MGAKWRGREGGEGSGEKGKGGEERRGGRKGRGERKSRRQ